MFVDHEHGGSVNTAVVDTELFVSGSEGVHLHID